VAKGKEALYRSARGGNASLTDAQVRAAVDYMISKQGVAK